MNMNEHEQDLKINLERKKFCFQIKLLCRDKPIDDKTYQISWTWGLPR